jgi:hypothetical protein
MMRTQVLALLVIAAASGCASHPAPTEQVASSLAAVRGADEVGARQVPEAALHLKLAEEQIEKSKQLMNDGENARAQALAERGRQDAELAIAIAREAHAKQKLDSFASTQPQAAGGEQPTNTQPVTQ